MPYYKKVIKAGNVIEVEYIHSSRKVGESIPRQPNRKRTREEQQMKNFFNARKKLSRLINLNFTARDLFISPTYRGRQPTLEQAEKYLKEYISILRSIFRHRYPDREFKWIAVTEYENKRIHHHIILSRMDLEEVADIWKHGILLESRLDKGEYTGLAHYITKEPSRPHKKRWGQSRNLIQPEPEYEEVSAAVVSRTVPPIKGYRKVYEIQTETEEGKYRYAKFISNNAYDLAYGKEDESPEDYDEST